MKVLFLGAGASMPASYPSARGLLAELQDELEQTSFVQARQAWEQFTEFREGRSQPWASTLANPNPEIVLSALDLLNASLSAERAEIQRRVREADDPEARQEALSEYSEPVAEGYLQARRTRRSFLRALDHYLAVKHIRDAESRKHREYLHRLIGRLGDDGIVVTTNWDTLAERTLLEQDRWTPFDGYGIEFPLEPAWPEQDPPPVPEWVPRHSEIQVLKLHGSFGWHREEYPGDGRLYLQHARFLQGLPVEDSGRTVYLRDPNEPQPPGTRHRLELAYPSYLKRGPTNELQEIWRAAAEAIQSAHEVEVVGFSLPAEDVAIRTLLMPLASDEVDVVVREPDPNARDRWSAFLDGNLTFAGRVG